MKKLSFISLAVLAFSLQSCRKDYMYVAPIVPQPSNLSFAADILPLINANHCNNASCHDGSAQAPDLTAANAFTALTTGGYIDTITPSASGFYKAVSSTFYGDQMPAVGGYPDLTAAEQAKILAWIEQGAKP